jgi:hypothetical protein
MSLRSLSSRSLQRIYCPGVLEIIAVFSARLYGSRSRKNQKLLDGVKRAVEESRQ